MKIKSYQQFLNESNGFSIQPINMDDIPSIIELIIPLFPQFPVAALRKYLNRVADWKISVKAVLNDEIIGAYLLNTSSVTKHSNIQLEDLSKYESKKGIQGIAIAIKKEYRNKSYGKQLRDYPISLKPDYVWGEQIKELNNLTNWTKFGRRLVAKDDNINVTLMDIK